MTRSRPWPGNRSRPRCMFLPPVYRRWASCGPGLAALCALGRRPAREPSALRRAREPSELRSRPGCFVCPWAAARPRAVRAASPKARRVVLKPGQAPPPPTATAARPVSPTAPGHRSQGPQPPIRRRAPQPGPAGRASASKHSGLWLTDTGTCSASDTRTGDASSPTCPGEGMTAYRWGRPERADPIAVAQ